MNDFEKEKLITENTALIYFVLNKSFSAIQDYYKEELVSIGMIALNSAIDTYEVGKGRFSTYAVRTIRNEMFKYTNQFNYKKRTKIFDVPLSIDYEYQNMCSVDKIEDYISSDYDLEDISLKKDLLKQVLSFLIKKVEKRDYDILMLKYVGYSNIEISNMYGISYQRVGQILDNITKLTVEEFGSLESIL